MAVLVPCNCTDDWFMFVGLLGRFDVWSLCGRKDKCVGGFGGET